MRIPKRLIKKVADEKLREKGMITQIEIHEEIERVLGRELTQGEKVRITLVLRNEYPIKEIDEDTQTRVKIRIFTL